MTDPSQNRKKKKITIIASPQGVERAENALIRLGFDSKSNFAKSQLLARNTVTKFFQREPIQLDSFKRICEALKLKWIDIAEEEQSERIERKYRSSLEINEEVGQMQTLHRKVTVIDKHSKLFKAEIILKGDINSVFNFKIIQLFLQEHSGDTITITDIQEGSIRLIVEGSQEDIKRLVSQFESGELTEVNGFPVEDAQILSEISDDDESNELDEKWRLVQEIVSQPVKGRNLRGADLSDVDLSDVDLSDVDLSDVDLSEAHLSGADLSEADLSGADLSGANLSGANLSLAYLKGAIINKETRIDGKWRLIWKIVNHGAIGRDLSNANLSGANLSDANLSGANLSGANLSGANLSGANLSGANLSGANLIAANLSSANLSGANLIAAYLSNANLSGANLSGANLSGANLSLAYLKGAIINKETRIDRKWRLIWEIVNHAAVNLDLSNADLSRANLSRANLSRANLSDANLSRANLSRADLSDANLIGANLNLADLNLADLSDANLSGANLSDADLSDADLSGADLSGAIVMNALFGRSKGLTEDTKRDLKQRGAIFGDEQRKTIFSDPSPVPKPK
ncbi:pentapeptide repeat-containing protein [Brasilonema octagenarum UFV-E1]|nr:pentapeptide repeat-containing protein [Brasilonema octagenarum UFV-E1]